MLQTFMARCTLVALVCSITFSAHAMADDAATRINVPAGELVAALETLSRQTAIDLVFQPEQLKAFHTDGVNGTYSPQEAIRILLRGTPLELRTDASSGAMVIAAPSRGETTREDREATHKMTDLEAVTVTGTRIRGGATPSPVITIGAEKIREEGFADLGEVIRSVPQNFGGGQNPGVVGAVGSGNSYNQNVTGGSSLNLRGAGADATLTLLNGRRRSYGGLYDSVDISVIPVEAVDRIEIVTDGASAIYGSDAIAGVGNVILRRDFDGVMLGTRYGASADGGMSTHEYTGTTGGVWDSGGLIASVMKVSADPIDVSDRRYTRAMTGPDTLYPGEEMWSGLLSGHQSLGTLAEARLDVLRSARKQVYYQRYSTFWYDNRTENATWLVSPTVEFFLPRGWTLSAGGTWSKDDNDYDIWTVIAASGATSLTRRACNCNESRSYEVNGEGPLFAMPGGDARLAVGAGYRANDYLNAYYSSGIAYSGDETSRFGYVEMHLPLVGSASNITGVRRLALTAALRGEDYDNFGSVVTPKVGLTYDPDADFTAKVSWGKSFKAPMLSRRYGNRFVYLAPTGLAGGAGYPSGSTLLITWGANPDLKPERARTLTASLAFHPEALPGLEAELSGFDIDYTDRVLAPIAVVGQIFSNPALADFVDDSPSAEQQAALLSAYNGNIQNLTGVAYDPSRVVAIAYNNYTNAERQKIRGVDLSGSYRFDLSTGRMTVRGSASWLDSTQQNTSGQSAFDLAGTIFYPAKLTGRLGAVWARGGFTASTFANYTDGVRNYLTLRKTASFTTFDATLRYMIAEGSGAASGWDFALSAQNLLNRAPPAYTPAATTDVPYDSTNYSAIGRFLSVSLAKRW